MITIIEDTRQQADKHEIKHKQMEQLGAKIIRSKLPLGDYALMTDMSTVIDTKKDMNEMYSNIIHDHVRFNAEIKLAKECGIKLIFLIEQGHIINCIDDVAEWSNPQVGKRKIIVRSILVKNEAINKFQYLTIEEMEYIAKQNNIKIPKIPVPSPQLAVAMHTLEERYGCKFLFCAKKDTGRRIIEILGGE